MKFRKLVNKALATVKPKHLPDFLIIGAQKCGTTSLHYYLGQSPQLIGSTPKEVHFFNRGVYFNQTLDDYKKSFRGFSFSVKYFEATPAYLYQPNTAELIHRYLPNSKMIVLLRDPTKRAYSAWNHYRQYFESGHYVAAIQNKPRRDGNLLFDKFFKGRTVFPSFRECLNIELDLMEKGVGFEPALIRRGLYLAQLEEYWRFFDKDQIMVIGFKDFVKDIKGTLSNIEDFIGLPKHDWSGLVDEPRNQRSYQEQMRPEDEQFLNDYFSEHNQKLFEKIGHMNW